MKASHARVSAHGVCVCELLYIRPDAPKLFYQLQLQWKEQFWKVYRR